MTGEDETRFDQSAIAGLYAEHAPDMRRFLRSLLKNDEAAADALQRTFTKLIEQGHTARTESIRGWMFRIAYNEAMLARRVDQRAQRARQQWTLRKSHPSEQPDDGLMAADEQQRVRQALLNLSDGQRVVVEKRIYEEKTFAQIAADLELPLGTVLTRMRAALQRLSQHLNAEE